MAQETATKTRMDNDALLTSHEVARLLHMSERWVHERTRRREIPCYRLGNVLRFDRAEILAWIQQWREHPERESAR